MPDLYARILSRLLPARARRDFEPALQDARIEHLTRGRRTHSRFIGFILAAPFAAAITVLFLGCWNLIITEFFGSFRQSRFAFENPSRERTAMFVYTVRHAFRMLRLEPAFTAAVVLTLALGVGANVAVFAVVEALLLRPLPYTDSENLAILRHRDLRTGITKEFIAIGDFVDLSSRQAVFDRGGGHRSPHGKQLDGALHASRATVAGRRKGSGRGLAAGFRRLLQSHADPSAGGTALR